MLQENIELKKEKIIVIVGPTGVGKTALSIELATKLNGEIISGDSMQIYKGMDIGTAKVTKEEMKGIRHHLIDIIEPSESFSVADFQHKVRETITDIISRGKLPIIAGGTGLYITSVLYDYRFHQEEVDEETRVQLEKELAEIGPEAMYERLLKVDPVAAQNIHPNNTRRVVRALEVFQNASITKTEIQETNEKELLYDAYIIGLTSEREILYDRINKRVDKMMEEGLLEEAKSLFEQNLDQAQSVQAIGYKELFQYFRQEISIDEAIMHIKRNSRRYAKRQLTWFRNKLPVVWYDLISGDYNQNIAKILSDVEGSLKD